MSLYIQDGFKVYEADEDNLIHHIRTNSVVTGCGVTAQAVPNMTVIVAAGSIQYNGAIVTVAGSGSLAIAAADPAQPRIDVVHVTNAGAVAVVSGTPSATPKPPALPANSLLLAFVSVAAAGVNIQNSNITDRRLIAQAGLVVGQTLQVGSPNVSSAGMKVTRLTSGQTSSIHRYVSQPNSPSLYDLYGGTMTGENTGTLDGSRGFLIVAVPAANTLSIRTTTVASFVAGDISTVVSFGPDYVAIGTTPATAGAIRLPNNTKIQWRNAADTANVTGIYIDGANNGWFDVPTGQVIHLGIAGNTKLDVGDGYIAIYPTPAAAGAIRLPNAAYITARNAANTADQQLMRLDASSRLSLYADTVTIGGSGFMTLGAATTSGASLTMPHGVAPSSPVNGDMWTTTAGLFVRINGVTKTVTLT